MMVCASYYQQNIVNPNKIQTYFSKYIYYIEITNSLLYITAEIYLDLYWTIRTMKELAQV